MLLAHAVGGGGFGVRPPRHTRAALRANASRFIALRCPHALLAAEAVKAGSLQDVLDDAQRALADARNDLDVTRAVRSSVGRGVGCGVAWRGV
jgi:hypothetical protein